MKEASLSGNECLPLSQLNLRGPNPLVLEEVPQDLQFVLRQSRLLQQVVNLLLTEVRLNTHRETMITCHHDLQSGHREHTLHHFSLRIEDRPQITDDLHLLKWMTEGGRQSFGLC